MNDRLVFVSGFLCGALLMYILDPSAGTRRRSRVVEGVGTVGTRGKELVGNFRSGFAHRDSALDEAKEVVKAASRMPVGGNLAPQDDGSLNPS